jgi:hypothetical protein
MPDCGMAGGGSRSRSRNLGLPRAEQLHLHHLPSRRLSCPVTRDCTATPARQPGCRSDIDSSAQGESVAVQQEQGCAAAREWPRAVRKRPKVPASGFTMAVIGVAWQAGGATRQCAAARRTALPPSRRRFSIRSRESPVSVQRGRTATATAGQQDRTAASISIARTRQHSELRDSPQWRT